MELINILVSSSCDANAIKRILSLFGNLFNIIKIAVPIIVIVMGTIDLVKAMMANDSSNSQKALTTFAKRLVIAVVIFFVFPIVSFLMGLIGQNMEENRTCMDCFLYPNDKSKCYFTTNANTTNNSTESNTDASELLDALDNLDKLSEVSER